MLTQEMPGFAAYTLKTLRSLLKVHVIQGRDYKGGKENVENLTGQGAGTLFWLQPTPFGIHRKALALFKPLFSHMLNDL